MRIEAQLVMRACVVYESIWGNTAAVAAAIAEGIGPDARAVPTDEASDELIGGCDLIVAGAPVLGFRLPTDGMRSSAARSHADDGHPADLTHPSLRAWLARIPAGWAFIAAFETRLHWSPGGATATIEHELGQKGYRRLARAAKFFVKGTYGPLAEGELERARSWGRTLGEEARARTPSLAAAAH
jgi:hypothetical protein